MDSVFHGRRLWKRSTHSCCPRDQREMRFRMSYANVIGGNWDLWSFLPDGFPALQPAPDLPREHRREIARNGIPSRSNVKYGKALNRQILAFQGYHNVREAWGSLVIKYIAVKCDTYRVATTVATATSKLNKWLPFEVKIQVLCISSGFGDFLPATFSLFLLLPLRHPQEKLRGKLGARFAAVKSHFAELTNNSYAFLGSMRAAAAFCFNNKPKREVSAILKLGERVEDFCSYGDSCEEDIEFW